MIARLARALLATALGAGAASAALAEPLASPVVAPSYSAEACCQLCPRVDDPKNYLTNYLVNQKYLFEGKPGWIFRSELDMREDFEPEDPLLYADLAQIRRAFAARGTEVVLVVAPPRGLVETAWVNPPELARYNDKAAEKAYVSVLDKLRKAGFTVPDMTRFLREPASVDPFYFKRDDHWTPAGSRRAAKLVAETVRGLPVAAKLPKTEFVSERAGIARVYGAISLISSALCGGEFPDEVVPKFVTKAAASSEQDLFGDTQAPEVTLIGTSMSANPNYHFHGFLQTELGTEILNAAKSGGSIDGAMTEYLLSPQFKAHPPKLLVWEFVIQQFTVAKRNTLRRVAPLVQDGCNIQPVLLENTVTLKPGDDFVDVLFNGGSDRTVERASQDLVVDVSLDDVTAKELVTESWFRDGRSDQLRLRYNDFTDAKGHFVFELSDAPDHAEQPLVVLRAQLGPNATAPTRARVRLCAGAGR